MHFFNLRKPRNGVLQSQPSHFVQRAVAGTDKDLALQLRECMGQHLADTNYSVEQMARFMDYSCTQLYRKVKEFTALSSLEIRRKVCLSRAHGLLIRGL